MSAAENKAVFLSYASQDAEAARRICDALRLGGVEVWFDQRELVGGDAWDQKIRRQIKDCALLIPIISANTQSRTEGYFRLEWRLADQRTHLMAKGRPFLLPVVIDDTRDADAQVPDSFAEVQWTKLPGGETAEKFCARVKLLLDGVAAPAVPGRESAAPAARAPVAKRLWPVSATIAVAIAVVAFYATRSLKPDPAGHPAPTYAAEPATSSPLAKGWEIDAKGIDASQDELLLAESLAQRELERNPSDAEAYALLSRINSTLYRHHEPSAARKEAAASFARKALSLAADDRRARLAQGRAYLLDAATLADGQGVLRKLAAESPANPEVLLAYADSLIYGEEEATGQQNTEAIAVFDRVLKLRPFDALAMYGESVALWNLGRLPEAEALVTESIARHRNTSALFWKFWTVTVSRNDPAEARQLIEQFPADLRRNPMAVRIVSMFWLTQREPEKALGWLAPFPHEFIRDKNMDTPKGLMVGKAHAQAGRLEAARLEWRKALDAVERRLQAEPQSTSLVASKARLQALLGDKAAAARTAELYRQLATPASDPEIDSWIEAFSVTMDTGDVTRAIPMVESAREFLLTLPAAQVTPRLQTLATRLDRYQVFYPAVGDTAEYHALQKLLAPARPLVAAEKIDQKSVAVLAFANLSDDKGNEYFSDGISEELLNVLAKIPGLKVTARTSSFHFKGKDTPIPEIAKQLGVAYVVEGSVRKSGDKVRITAQLIKAADGFHVWSDTFTRDLKDIFAVQDEIAGLIAQNLSLRLGVDRSTSGRATVPEAFELYLEGRAAWNLRTREGYARAESLLGRAIELDPGFARAHAALADVWIIAGYENESGGGTYGWRNSPTVAQVAAKAEQALTLDPNCAEAYTTLALALELGWKQEAASRAYQHAVELNPNYATARHWFGMLLWMQGRMDEGLRQLKQATESDPLSHRILDTYARMLIQADRPDEALAVADRALALQPMAIQAATQKAHALVLLGRANEAVVLIEKVLALSASTEQRTNALLVLKLAGAEAVMRRVIGSVAELPSSQFKFASLIALGRPDEALSELRPADLHENQLINMALFRFYDPVREDPRFMKAISDVGYLEDYRRARAWLATNVPKEKK